MPQNPLIARQGGTQDLNNISATTVVKASPGVLWRVSVTTAGSGAGAIYDNNSTSSGNTAANKIGVIPNTVGVYTFIWPCAVGMVYVPGSGQVASVSFA